MAKLYTHDEKTDKEFSNLYRLIAELLEKIRELEAIIKAKG